MAKKYTADDIANLQKKNADTVKNQVIPSLNKVTGSGLTTGKVSSYQPTDAKQQRTIIDSNKPLLKATTPQQSKTTSNTMTIGGRTFNVSPNANSNSTLTSANNMNVVTPERVIKNNTREYAYGQKNKIGSLLAKTGYGLGASIEGVGALAKGLAGKEVTDRDLRATRARENYAAGATSDMGNIGNFAYGLGSSAADMGMDALLTMGNTWAMPTLSGFRTAADTINNAKERGISDRQAAVSGLLSGGIDFAMNKVGLNALEDSLARDGSSRLRNIGAGMAAEGGEEALQNILDEVADNIVNGKQSNDYLSYMNYKNSGMSNKDAVLAVAKDRLFETLQAAGGGALFGGVFGGLKTNSDIPQLEQQNTNENVNSQNITEQQTQRLLNDTAKPKEYPQPIKDMIDKTRRENPLLLGNADDATVYDFIQNRNEKMTTDELANQNYNNIYNVMNNTDAETVAPIDNGVDAGNAIDLLSQGDAADAIAEFRQNNPLISQGMSNTDVLTYLRGISEAEARNNNIGSQTNSMLDLINNNTDNVNSVPTDNANVPDSALELLQQNNSNISPNNIPGLDNGSSMNMDNNASKLMDIPDDIPTDETQTFAEASAQGNIKQKAQVKLKSKNIPKESMSKFNTAVKDIEFDNRADAQQFETLVTDLKNATETLYSPELKTRADVSGALFNIQKAYDNMSNFLKDKGTISKMLDNGKRTEVDNFYELTRGTKLKVTPELLSEANLDGTSIFELNNLVNFTNRKNDRLFFTTKDKGSTTIEQFAIENPEVMNTIGAEPGDSFADILTKLLDYTSKLHGMKDTADVVKADADDIIDWDVITKDAGDIAARIARQNQIPRVGEAGSMALDAGTQAEIANGTMGVDAEGNLEAYENVGLNDLPQLPKAGEPYLTAMDIAEGRTTPTGGNLNRVLDAAPEINDTRYDSNGNINLNTKLSQYGTNTAVRNGFYTENEIYNDPTIRAIFEYTPQAEMETLGPAMDRLINNPKQWENGYLTGTMTLSDATDLDTAMLLSTDYNNNIDSALASGDNATVNAERAKLNLLSSKIAEFGREHGRDIQAYAKWTRHTAAGAQSLANDTVFEVTNKWAKNNPKLAKQNSLLARALADMGNKDAYKTKESAPKTHEQLREEVVNTLDREFGSVEQHFDDNAIDTITAFIEGGIQKWQLTDEITHYLNHGEWYTIDESTQPKYERNVKLENALNSLVNNEPKAEKAPASLEEIRKQITNSLERENSGFVDNLDLSDDDIDYLSNLIYYGATKQEIESQLNTKLATGSFGIKPETLKRVNEIFNEISHYDINSKEFVDGESKAYAMLADEVLPTATFSERFNNWRFMSMLASFATAGKNIVGNKTNSVLTGFSNNLAALMEAAIDNSPKGGIERTKSILNPISDRNLIKLSRSDADNSRHRDLSGTKYSKSSHQSELERNRNVWSTKSDKLIPQLASKAMTGASNFVDTMLSDEKDMKFKYSTSLAGYLKANGLDETVFDTEARYKNLLKESKTRELSADERHQLESYGDTVNLLNKARDYAVEKAKYATFHQDNDISEGLTSFSNKLNNSGKVSGKIGHRVIEGLAPFKGVPVNIIFNSYDHSMMKGIENVLKTGKLTADTAMEMAGKSIKGEKINGNDLIDDWAKFLTGTGLTVLGGILGANGLIRTSNPDTDEQDSLEGRQKYSIEIDGKSIGVDMFAPAATSVFIGVELQKLLKKNGYSVDKLISNAETLDDVLNMTSNLTSPIVEMSMLSGLDDNIRTIANGLRGKETPGAALADVVLNSMTSYYTQGVPTMLGQAARTLDNTRRSTYTNKDGMAGVLDKQSKKIQAKIPGLSQNLEPYVDAYGREQKNTPFDNPVADALYKFASPTYISNINETKADRSARALYNRTNDSSVFAERDYSKKINIRNAKGEIVNTRKLTPSEFTVYSKEKGAANKRIREIIADDKNFKRLTAEQQKDILAAVDNVSDKIGESKVNNTFKSDDNVYEAYMNGKEKGVASYLIDKTLLDSGAKAYKDKNGKSKTFSSCSLQEQSEIVNKLVNQNKMTKSQAAKYLKDTDKFIVMDGNTKETLESKYGSEGASLYYDLTQNALNEKGSMTTSSALPYLKSKGVSQDLAGDILYSLSNSDNVDTIYNEMGGPGVYTYYDVKENADGIISGTDPNGYLDTKEVKAYLDSLNLTRDQKRYWFGKFFTNPKTHNPY